MPVSSALIYISFRVLSKRALPPGFPRRASTGIEARFPKPSICLSSVNEPPQGSPTEPQWREQPNSIALFHIFPESTINQKKTHLPFKTPVDEPIPRHPPKHNQRGHEDAPFRGSMVYSFIHSFIHSYLSESPVKEFSDETRKIHGHRPRSPTWTEGLHTTGCSLLPQGDRLRHCYYFPIAMQHDTFHLGLDRAPVASV
jgi:hypothetical protein